jgi:hypothetical protein
MVRLLLLLASILALAGCTSHCQELGNRLCQCRASNTTIDQCENAVKNDVQRANPGKNTEDECKKALDTCKAPLGADGNPIDFCDFLAGRCGKALCRVSAESYCDADVCKDHPDIYCNPDLCAGTAETPTAAICDPTSCTAATVCEPSICTAATVCDPTVCPVASQPPSCTTTP